MGETHNTPQDSCLNLGGMEAFLEEGASKLTSKGQPGEQVSSGQNVPGKKTTTHMQRSQGPWQTSGRLWWEWLLLMYGNYAINYKLLIINSYRFKILNRHLSLSLRRYLSSFICEMTTPSNSGSLLTHPSLTTDTGHNRTGPDD